MRVKGPTRPGNRKLWLSACCCKIEVRDFFIFMSVVGVGMWYLHTHPLRNQSPPEAKEIGGGDIVIAKAPDGSLVGRWPSPTPAPRAESQR